MRCPITIAAVIIIINVYNNGRRVYPGPRGSHDEIKIKCVVKF